MPESNMAVLGRKLAISAGAISLALTSVSFAQAPAPSELAARFGALPAVTDTALSPDGQNLLFIAPAGDNATDLFVVAMTDGAAPKRILRASGKPDRLQWCRFVNAERILCQIVGRQKLGDEIYGFSNIVSLGVTGGDVKALGVRRGQNALGFDLRGPSVIDWTSDDGGSVLMMRSYVPEANLNRASLIKKTDEGMGVDRVDVASGAPKVFEKPRRDAVEYITDGRGTVRVMGVQPIVGQTQMLDRELRYFYRPLGGGDWQFLAKLDVLTDEGFNPVTVDAASNTAIGFVKHEGRIAMASMALDGSGKQSILFAHPQVDVDKIVRVGRDRRVVGASFVTEKRAMETTDPKVAAMARALRRALGGKQIYFTDASSDEAHWLLWAGSDTDPGRFYRYTPAAKQLRPLLDERPALTDRPLAPMRPISFPAADGTLIPGYLTLPLGKDSAAGLPAIVMPHGGPSARDEWGFDWLVQYFAAQGYAVLQPNFRGSSGYGDAWYQRNGFQSWRIAIGDVTDAGRWLVGQGADAKRLAIVGWSYGGYAALQSGVLAPDLFKSIVAIAPVTDLEAMKAESQRYINAAITRDFFGSGPHIREGSPAKNAASIMAPVLMFHGTEDQNVNIEQADIMQSALQDAGKRSELIKYPGLAHALWDADARTDMLRRISAFLPK